MKTIKIQGPAKASIVDAPKPQLRPGYMLLKAAAVALNPTDWKHVEYFGSQGATVGCDYAGIVEEVGEGVTEVKKGDRYAGFAHGCNAVQHEDGAFAEYLVARVGVGCKIPDNLSFEEAATLGIGITTVGQGLYQSMGLPWPDKTSKDGESILIYGASTATGTLAVQFATLSGFKVIATSSPHNFALLKSLGAVQTFDYKSETVGKDINEYTKNSLYYAFDCISEGTSPAICAAALSTDTSSRKPKYGTLLPVQDFAREEDVQHSMTLGYTAIGKAFTFANVQEWPAKEEDYRFAKRFWDVAQPMLASGKIKVHPVDSREGGLEGVLSGMQDMKNDKVSGKKLVYKL